jgi:hypothetical protein
VIRLKTESRGLKAEGRSGEILCRMGAASVSRDCWSYVCSKVQGSCSHPIGIWLI